MKQQDKKTFWLFLLMTAAIWVGPTAPEALRIDTIYKKTTVITGDGQKLSVSVQDAEIQSVLNALSQQKGLNIVCSPEVNGKISVHLHNVSLQEALDAVITMNGYDYTEKEGVLFVSKGDQKQKGLGHAWREEVRTYRLNYVDMDQIFENVKEIVSPTAMVTIYKPEKTLIIQDIPLHLDRVDSVLKKVDVPPRQVLIEAKILEVQLTDDMALGVDWNLAFEHFSTAGNLLSQGFALRKGSGAQGLFFESGSDHFSAFLDALETSSKVNTLSTPKIIALNGRQAEIIVGGKLGYYVTTTTNTATLQSVEFLETGTVLVLTPHIMDDGNIIMEIHPEVSDGSVTAGLPAESTTELTTTLIAEDGGTIFLGGLIRDRKEDLRDQVPGLGCLPLFGALFGRSYNSTQKTEIIVLITPHIVTPKNKIRVTEDLPRVDEVKKQLDLKRSLREVIPGLQ